MYYSLALAEVDGVVGKRTGLPYGSSRSVGRRLGQAAWPVVSGVWVSVR